MVKTVQRKPQPLNFGRTASVALTGLSGTLISIETSVNPGIPGIDISGMPDTAVSESRKRIRAALANIGVSLRPLRYTIYLSPGGVRKHGTGFDLAIAIGILVAEGIVPASRVQDLAIVGELGLDGRILPVRGVLPHVLAAGEAGMTRALVPAGCADEARLARCMEVVGAASLAAVAHLLGANMSVAEVETVYPDWTEAPSPYRISDLSQVKGQAEARFALEVAAAGGHHLLMVGVPGCGKTLLAQCLPSILPELSDEAAVSVMALLALVGGQFCPAFVSDSALGGAASSVHECCHVGFVISAVRGRVFQSPPGRAVHGRVG